MPDAVVKKVDHVLLKTGDARALFGLLTEGLGLPIAWPLFHYAGCLSGAVALGRVSLEVLQPLGDSQVRELLAPGTRLIGLAFEPYDVPTALATLDARGLGHGPPQEFTNSDGHRWTSVPLEYWAEAPIRLLVKYPWDQDQRWDAFEGGLRTKQGGALGIQGLDEVVIGVKNAAGVERWSALLGAADAVGLRPWRPAQGPALRVEPASRDGMTSLVLTVADVRAAAAELDRRNLLAGDEGDAIQLQLTRDQETTLQLRQR
jgi:hypothetical protein